MAEERDFDADEGFSNLATPEGDNEYLPDEPLTRGGPKAERPRGNEPHPGLPIRKALETGKPRK
jgi:hypothetical protein